jgi:hypothetical protein
MAAVEYERRYAVCDLEYVLALAREYGVSVGFGGVLDRPTETRGKLSSKANSSAISSNIIHSLTPPQGNIRYIYQSTRLISRRCYTTAPRPSASHHCPSIA